MLEMGRAPFFLWPKPNKLAATDLVGPLIASGDIETELRAFFPDSEPVLFSSARAGLTAILQSIGLSRQDLLWIPPFSSHCVIDAVGHICTPTPLVTGQLVAALVYHQWGHCYQSYFSTKVKIIEDSVDSLLIPGKSPFVSGGAFALWSLPKVLATQSGGVVFCKHKDDANALRDIRDRRGHSVLQGFLRGLSKSNKMASVYWNGAEAMQGEMGGILCRQINRRLGMLHDLVEDRVTFLRKVVPDLSDVFEKRGRLPSNLPLRVPHHWERVWGPAKQIRSGLRSYNASCTYPDTQWVKVAPLPVHMDVAWHHIEQVCKILELKGGIHEFEIV